MKHHLLTLSMIVLAAGCSHQGTQPRERFTLKTVDGRDLVLMCPLVTAEQAQNPLHLIESQCVAVRP